MSTEPVPSAKTEIRTLNKRLASCEKKLSRERGQAMRERGGVLGRSSLEAYAGITLGGILALYPVTWYIRIGIILGLAFVWGDFALRSPWSCRWGKFRKSVTLIAVLGCIGFAGWKNVVQAYTEAQRPPDAPYMTSYGANVAKASCTLTVNGTLLEKYADDSYLMATCFHYDRKEDWYSLTGEPRSERFDIRDGNIDIDIPWNQKYIAELAKERGTNVVVLLVPKSVAPDSFTTIKDALSRGAYVLGTGFELGGP